MLRKISFILFLAITLSGEGMLTVTLLWTILDKGGSAINIGLILAIMSVVPFLIQKYVRPVRTVLTHRPLQVFALARLGGLVVLGLPLLFPEEMMIYSLYLLAGLFSVILFLSIQSLEAYMSHMVLEGALSADQASNTLQTSIQIGAFGGNALAGLLLSLGGFFTVMIGLAVSLGIGMVLPYVASFFAAALNPQKREQEKTIKQTEITEESRKKILQLTVFAVALLTVQLASFNFLLPILFHDVREWGSLEYGLVSSAAGVGAFLATIIGRWVRYVPHHSFLLIAVLDIFIAFFAFWPAVVIMSFLLGFVFNRNRIVQRSMMFAYIKNKEETTFWSSRSTLAFQLMKAIVPLVLVFPLFFVGNQQAGLIFSCIGVIVSAGMYFIYSREKGLEKGLLENDKVKLAN